VDAFRDAPGYQLITGGQFVHHPAGSSSTRCGPPQAGSRIPWSPALRYSVRTEQYYVHVDPAIDVLAVTEFVDDLDVPGASGP